MVMLPSYQIDENYWCLMGAWWVPDGCLMGAWWVPDGCLTAAWQLPWWLPDGYLVTAWLLGDDYKLTAGQLPDKCRLLIDQIPLLWPLNHRKVTFDDKLIFSETAAYIWRNMQRWIAASKNEHIFLPWDFFVDK